VVTGLIGGFPQSALIVALLGVVGGYFIPEDRRVGFLVATLALAMVHGALTPIPVLGEYLTGALGGLSSLYNAAAVTVIVVRLVEGLKP
jgi:hypothetical protein